MSNLKMGNVIKHFALASVMLFSAQAFAGDGTLPVRLPGDGTLPTLVGDAIDLTGQGTTIPAKVKFTQLIVKSIDGGSSAFNCRDAGPQ